MTLYVSFFDATAEEGLYSTLHSYLVHRKNIFFFYKWHTFQVFGLELLTAGLVLKLIILTDKVVAEGALEYPTTMIPHPSVALDAGGIGQRARAGVSGETLAAMTHPSLTEVTDGTLEGEREREGGEQERDEQGRWSYKFLN